MSIEGSPAQEEGIQQSQSIREALVGRGYVEQGGDLLAQACGTLLGGHPLSLCQRCRYFVRENMGEIAGHTGNLLNTMAILFAAKAAFVGVRKSHLAAKGA